MIRRGDVVIVDFRSVSPAAGVRPALIVQNDRDNGRMRDCGAHRRMNCSNLYMVRHSDIVRTIGALSAAGLQEINNCLKAALGIP